MDENRDEVLVLVVDDDSSVSRAVVRLVRGAGYGVREFNDPAHALDELTETAARAIVVDYEMPGITGAQLVRHVRAADGPSRLVPAVLMTGARETVPVSDRLLFEAIVSKPFDPPVLLELISRCVKLSGGMVIRSGTRRRAGAEEETDGDAGTEHG